jgi:hypothetical protein
VHRLSARWQDDATGCEKRGDAEDSKPTEDKPRKADASSVAIESDEACRGRADRRRWPLIPTKCVLAPCLGILVSFVADVGKSASHAASVSLENQVIPLQTLSTATIAQQDGYLAWSGPALCDEDENAYFLVPTAQNNKAGAPAQAVTPHDVLRVSADGQKRVSFSPVASSKFASVAGFTTVAMALGRHGTLFMLIWARWRNNGDQTEVEKNGQYIVSFNQKGEYQSHLEIDGQEMLVNQFEVFGSGEFLLRGSRPHTAEQRLAILSASGGTLRDVEGWPGNPSEEPSPESPPKFDHMVRGSDGRIYVTQEDVPKSGDVVYAISASGDSERVFKLRPMRRDPQLMGWKAADHRFAAIYLDAAHRLKGSAGEQRGRWWIAVYSDVADGAESQSTIYGPAPGPPICYQHKGSRDRFTFVADGAKLVTMSPR